MSNLPPIYLLGEIFTVNAMAQLIGMFDLNYDENIIYSNQSLTKFIIVKNNAIILNIDKKEYVINWSPTEPISTWLPKQPILDIIKLETI